MKRRTFIAGLGSMAAWPVLARAQQPQRVRRVGVPTGLAEDDPQSHAELTAFQEALSRFGWIEGRNLQSSRRFAAGDDRRIRAYAEELLSNSPDIIVARGTQATAILKQQTNTIPILFAPVSDPVASGFVANFARPAGNATGFIDEEYSFGGKWPSILKSISPNISRVMMLYDPTNPNWEGYLRALQSVAASLALSISEAPVTTSGDIGRSIELFAHEPDGGMIVVPSGLIIVNRQMIIALAAEHRLAAVYPFKVFAASGGLAAYGADLPDIWRRAAGYVDRILKGDKPGELPVQAPIKFELVINANTAKALGLTIPETLLATADEVIQ
jgi:putative ABC transport system substrate-binding protein